MEGQNQQWEQDEKDVVFWDAQSCSYYIHLVQEPCLNAQCQGGQRCEMEYRLVQELTYWNLLKLELEIGVQILGKPNQNTTMTFYRNRLPDSKIYQKYKGSGIAKGIWKKELEV